jgi:hypothetical protein
MKIRWFLPLAVVTVFSASCGSTLHSIDDQMEDIQISRRSKVSLTTVRQIADARGGKEDGEMWKVDRHKGDVRIAKSREGGGPSFELWYQDENGSWVTRPERVK